MYVCMSLFSFIFFYIYFFLIELSHIPLHTPMICIRDSIEAPKSLFLSLSIDLSSDDFGKVIVRCCWPQSLNFISCFALNNVTQISRSNKNHRDSKPCQDRNEKVVEIQRFVVRQEDILWKFIVLLPSNVSMSVLTVIVIVIITTYKSPS